jgi:hypothetical protein
MEGLILLKASDIEAVFNQIILLRAEIKELKELEENTTAFTIEQTAKKLSLHYNSVRRLVIKGKLFAQYLNETHGKCVIPLWAIKKYLSEQQSGNEK